jgi:anti-sigma-K factor RskA
VDIQQFISSGIIEAYVLGIATEEEVQELEALSKQYPEVAAAIEDCQQTMDDFSTLQSIEPPAALKANIWAAIEADNNTVNSNNHTSFIPKEEVPASTTPQADNVVTFKNNNTVSSFPWKSAMAAAVVLLAGSLILNFSLWNKSNTSTQELVALKEKHQLMMDSSIAMQSEIAASKNDIQILSNPAMKPVMLAGVGTHTTNNAMVMWDTTSKAVYLALKNMPPPPSGKQYQLWAIVDGKPVDAGVYALNGKASMQKMKVIPSAQMFAITLEKEGGSDAPTMEAMYVAGKV